MRLAIVPADFLRIPAGIYSSSGRQSNERIGSYACVPAEPPATSLGDPWVKAPTCIAPSFNVTRQPLFQGRPSCMNLDRIRHSLGIKLGIRGSSFLSSGIVEADAK